MGLAARVRFVGVVPQAELRRYYVAADVLVLASSREGWPNVLLEAMACGTPVVATRVWGMPEIVAAPEGGVLVPQRTVPALQAGLEALLSAPPDRAATRRYAEGFDWSATTAAQIEMFERLSCTRFPEGASFRA
ncbi:glycosyltransferase [Azoarcus sp. PA01]|nr:glycosyltransferase [Azoarcus sp. PA01]